jgi:hypothetical protein
VRVEEAARQLRTQGVPDHELYRHVAQALGISRKNARYWLLLMPNPPTISRGQYRRAQVEVLARRLLAEGVKPRKLGVQIAQALGVTYQLVHAYLPAILEVLQQR